jgi:hypothetical protein
MYNKHSHKYTYIFIGIAVNENVINDIRKSIKNKFELSIIEEIDYIIGIKFIKCKNGYIIHQMHNSILENFEINKFNEI